jgi:hypothetical protein
MTGDDRSVLLMKNEVEHARQYFPNVSLFVVSGIRFDQKNRCRRRGQDSHARSVGYQGLHTCPVEVSVLPLRVDRGVEKRNSVGSERAAAIRPLALRGPRAAIRLTSWAALTTFPA